MDLAGLLPELDPSAAEQLLDQERVAVGTVEHTIGNFERRRRARELSNAAQDLLRVVAIAGRPVTHGLLVAVTDLTPIELASRLRAAVEHCRGRSSFGTGAGD